MEQNNTCQLFLWDDLFAWLKSKAVKYKVPLLTSLVVGFLAYTFTLTNKLINHDEAFSLFHKGSTVNLGRWFLAVMDRIFPNLSMPWIYGVITIALISVSVCMIVSIFQIRNKVLQGLLAGCIIAFPVLTSIFTYMYVSSSFGVSFFLATLAVWLVNKWKIWSILGGTVCLILALAIYQGYVALTAGMLVILVIQGLLKGGTAPEMFRKGLISLGFLIVSLGIYFLSTQVINWYLGLEFSDYATDRLAFSIWDIPAKAVLSYQRFLQVLFEHKYGLIPTPLSRALHLAALGCCVGLLAVWFSQQKKKDWLRCLLMAAMLLVLPLAINCMFLFTSDISVHTLLLYGFIGMYILAVVVADAMLTEGRLSKVKALFSSVCLHLLPLCMAIVIVINVYIANITSLHLFLRYEIAYSFYTSLSADIKMMPEFNEDSRLAVIGFYSGPDYYFGNFDSIDNIMGAYGFVPSDYSKEQFLEYYLDFDIPVVSDSVCEEIKQTQEFKDMPAYPYYGSMKWFDNILVVKVE